MFSMICCCCCCCTHDLDSADGTFLLLLTYWYFLVLQEKIQNFLWTIRTKAQENKVGRVVTTGSSFTNMHLITVVRAAPGYGCD
mmetsp:Transcript_16348/g.24208  ORF Transcript_16348/g.24208 Transcript_16348/m.24208 type:complete len:84 (-) Transcript_16348:900-1151(-)